MKTNKFIQIVVCLISSIIILNSNTYSQCPNGAPASSISYDSVFKGGGNNTYDLNFPQFDTSRIYLVFPQFSPSKGTLVQIDFQAVITVKNGYKVENEDQMPSLSKVKVLRSDVISSDALFTSFENTQSKTIAVNTLAGSDGVSGSGPDFKKDGPIYSYKNFLITNTLTSNMAGFLGNGEVVLNYETHTDLFSSGSNNVFTSTTEDSISFILTYHFCTTSILPADITNFTAARSGSGNVQLSWTVPNDNSGNKYEMQKSTDAINYSSIETIVAKTGSSNSYQVYYSPVRDDKNKVFFRIKQFDVDGSIKYSNVKTVELEYVSTMMKVYPTIAKTEVKINFQYAPKSDYVVQLLSLSGQLMQQSDFGKTNLIRLALKSSLKAGLYIVNVINKQTGEKQQSKLIIE